jgi:acetylornithine deacetylase
VLAPAWGEPFLFGPGSIHVAHTTQEKISKRGLLAAVDTYARMTRTLLSRAESVADSAGSPPKQHHA